jgi:hypothetical protein
MTTPPPRVVPVSVATVDCRDVAVLATFRHHRGGVAHYRATISTELADIMTAITIDGPAAGLPIAITIEIEASDDGE